MNMRIEDTKIIIEVNKIRGDMVILLRMFLAYENEFDSSNKNIEQMIKKLENLLY